MILALPEKAEHVATSTPPKAKDTLVAVAGRLARAAPNTWIEFIDAFSAYHRERESVCVHAPSDRVLVAQGGARQCQELLSLFTDAVKQK